MTKEERLERRAEQNKKRIWELDLLRALVIIGMLIDHLLKDFSEMFPALFNSDKYFSYSFLANMRDFGYEYGLNPTRVVFRFVGVIVLILLIGISSQFSKSNIKRALLLLGFGIVISCFTILGHHLAAMNYILIGAVMCFGLCLLIYCGVHAIFARFEKAWKWICLGTGLTILLGWLIVRSLIMRGEIESQYNNLFMVYHGYYRSIPYIGDIKDLNFGKFIEVLLGVTYFGADYIGIFPYLGYLFIGAFIGQTVYKDKKSLLHYFDKDEEHTLNELFNRKTSVLLFFGRKSMWFYVFHQPVYTLLMLFIGAVILSIPLSFI